MRPLPLPTPKQTEKWLPVAQQVCERWGIHHESLKGSIAMEFAIVELEAYEFAAREVENLGGDNVEFHAGGIRRRLLGIQD